jgi:hypothetical protein
MSFGQSILTVLALIVITFLVLSANRIVTQSLKDELKGEAFNQAGEIANDLINEALKTKFDDPTIKHYYTGYVWISYHWVWYSNYGPYYLYDFYQKPSDFTAPSSLGPTTSVGYAGHPDTYPYKSIGYDDFDDYNGYQRIVDTPIMKGFVVNCTVTYADSTNLNAPVNYRTYYKRLVVKLTQPTYLRDTLFFSTVMTY